MFIPQSFGRMIIETCMAIMTLLNIMLRYVLLFHLQTYKLHSSVYFVFTEELIHELFML
jgi:hypothetical protein